MPENVSGLSRRERLAAASDQELPGYDPQELLTPDEVCALLKMKRTWFYAEVGRGALHPLKLGRSTRVRRSDLEAYLTKLEQAG